MNCKYCNKVVSEMMTFCPYCGNRTDGEKSGFESKTDMRLQMATLYQNGKHDEILAYALEGDIFAKYYYKRYVQDMGNKGVLTNDKAFAVNLKKHMDEGSVFAKAILGICRYNYKISFSGVTDDWDEGAGKRLIRESAESDEPVAMEIWGEFLLKGYGVEKDEVTAYKMMKSAANQGYPPAIYSLGLWHRQGTAGISKNEELGNELIEKAAFLGDQDAQSSMRKQNSKWLNTELGYAIADDNLKSTLSLISSEMNTEDSAIPISLCDEYGRCQDVEDYVRLYKLLRDEYADDENTKDLFESLKQFIVGITGYSLDKMSIEEAQAWDKIMGQITEMTDGYTLPQHYLHFKDDIKTLEIDIADEDVPVAMRIVSKGLRSKCEKDFKKYIEYSKAKEDRKYPGFGCGLIFCSIIAIIGFMIFPIIGWIAGVFALLIILAKTSYESTFKKISRTNKESYLLVNALIGYGYALFTKSDWDPQYSYGEYNAKDVYENKIPSVYSKNTVLNSSKNIPIK